MSRMSKLYEYSAQRAESNELMSRLNLSDEFSEFKLNQEERHQSSMSKFEKTKIGSMMLTTAGTLGVAGCMIGGVLSAPALIAGIAAVYAIGGVGLGAKLGEMFSENKHNKNYGNSDVFLKEMDAENRAMGEDFYNDFVERMETSPGLSESLSRVSKKFNEKKESMNLEESLSSEIDSTFTKNENTSNRNIRQGSKNRI